MKKFGAKHTILVSNIPGFVKPVYYGGQRALRFFYMGAAAGNMCTGIVIVSIEKRCCITVSSDDT
jgi:hypothetical protein